MNIGLSGKVIRRFTMAAGLVLALNVPLMADEQAPRAMYGTTAWSDAWQQTCRDVDPSGTSAPRPGFEHLNKDCKQYEASRELRAQYLAEQHLTEQKPYFASNEVH